MSGLHEAVRRVAVKYGSESAHPTHDRFETGWAEIDAALQGGLNVASVHEWYGAASAADGRKWSAPIGILAYLARQAWRKNPSAYCAWVGRTCLPYPCALENDLLSRMAFVAVHDAASRLWAIDAALRCAAVAVVVADGSQFPMSATRKLQLLAQTNRKPVLLARPPWECDALSAAQSRWLVSLKTEKCPWPRWIVELQRCKGLPMTFEKRWCVEWQRVTGRIHLSTALAGDAGQAQTTSRAVERSA
ncbi:MAG: hypothetical protein JNG88_13890 [Phycisphaerales bacterium]|nr:hypothetical protein [Phycisphaerales bacterium]